MKMRASLLRSFLVLALAPATAQEIPVCAMNASNFPALTARAESGDAQAQLELGQAYAEAKDPDGLSLAGYWFKKAAEQSNENAEMRLSWAYGAGEGLPQNDDSALYWLNKAAEDGQTRALWTLGMYYRDGRHVERNQQTAFNLFLRAAKQGNVDAQFSVAQMYEDGDGVPRDYSQAVSWYKKAAEHVPDYGGAGQARNNLGLLYFDGRDIPQDYVTAYMYFRLANNKQNMQWAAERMSHSQIAEALHGAKEWMLQHPDPPACSFSAD
jgi:TPR repeat protein